jgi:hypothetical protein
LLKEAEQHVGLKYRDGIPTAMLIADNIQFLETLDDAREWTAQKELLRGPDHAPSISPSGHDEMRRDATLPTINRLATPHNYPLTIGVG